MQMSACSAIVIPPIIIPAIIEGHMSGMTVIPRRVIGVIGIVPEGPGTGITISPGAVPVHPVIVPGIPIPVSVAVVPVGSHGIIVTPQIPRAIGPGIVVQPCRGIHHR
jgi:hypothetical protein